MMKLIIPSITGVAASWKYICQDEEESNKKKKTSNNVKKNKTINC